MKIALFTGAGASRAIGYPLTNEFLPRVRSELKSGALFDRTNDSETDRKYRRELHGYLLRLLPGFERVPAKKLPLITDVFSLVDHALASGESLPIGGEYELRRCRDLLKWAITDILLGDFEEPWDLSRADHQRESALLRQIADWVHDPARTVGLVTTNYDIGIEHEVYSRMGRPHIRKTLDLGFDWREVGHGDRERTRPIKPSLRVYKLHGSLDQLRCPLCGYVYFNEYGAIAFQAFKDDLNDNNRCICGDDSRLALHIVSPSLVREVRDANLLSVWRSALEWMRSADRWIIAGYSLPPEDLAVRSLLLRAYATAPKDKKPEITVVQKDTNARHRYKLLFPDCHYEHEGLEGFLAKAGEGARHAKPRLEATPARHRRVVAHSQEIRRRLK